MEISPRTGGFILTILFTFVFYSLLIKRVRRSRLGYSWQDTPIHEMHIVPKIVMFATLSCIASFWMDPRYQIIVTVMALTLFFLSKAPSKWLWLPVLFLGSRWMSLIISVPLMTNPNLYKAIDPVWASITFWDVGTISVFGHISYTYGSIMWWLGGNMKGFNIALLSLTLFYTTNVVEISQYLSKAKLPNMVTFTFFVVFRFMPVMMKLSSNYTNALTMRGWGFKSKNPLTFVKDMYYLMYPIGRNFMLTTDIVTLSVVNRAFGANPMCPYKDVPFKRTYLYASLVMLVFICIVFYLTVTPPYYGNL